MQLEMKPSFWSDYTLITEQIMFPDCFNKYLTVLLEYLDHLQTRW